MLKWFNCMTCMFSRQSVQELNSWLLSWNHKSRCMVSQVPWISYCLEQVNLLMPGIKCYLYGNCKGDLFSSKKRCCPFSGRFQIEQIGTGLLFWYRFMYVCSLYCLRGFSAFGNRNVIAPAQISCFIAACEPNNNKSSILYIHAISFSVTQPFQ